MGNSIYFIFTGVILVVVSDNQNPSVDFTVDPSL